MIYGKLRRSGDDYIVRIPAEEVEALGLTDGELVVVEVRGVTVHPKLSPRIQELAEESWRKHETAYRKLAES